MVAFSGRCPRARTIGTATGKREQSGEEMETELYPVGSVKNLIARLRVLHLK